MGFFENTNASVINALKCIENIVFMFKRKEYHDDYGFNLKYYIPGLYPEIDIDNSFIIHLKSRVEKDIDYALDFSNHIETLDEIIRTQGYMCIDVSKEDFGKGTEQKIVFRFIHRNKQGFQNDFAIRVPAIQSKTIKLHRLQLDITNYINKADKSVKGKYDINDIINHIKSDIDKI